MSLFARRFGLFSLVALLTISAAFAADSNLLMEQPKGDFAARRKELMKLVKEAETKRPNMGGFGGMRGGAARKDAGAAGAGAPGAEPIVVMVGEAGSEEGKFRQENDFAYLTGVDIPGACLILFPDGTEKLYLPPRDLGSERWNGKLLGPDSESAKILGFEKVESTEAFLADLFKAASDPRKRTRRSKQTSLYMVAPEGRAGRAPNDSEFVKFIKMGAPNTPVRDVATLIHGMRPVKTEGEVALLRKAINITGDAQAEVVKLVKPGIPEYVLEGALEGAFKKGGAERPGFPSIVGSGPNSCVLHYMTNRRMMEANELVVVDIGAEYRNYTADITRTYPTSGKFSPRQREIYQLVLDAQTGAAAQFKSGESTIGALNGWVRNFFRESKLRAKDLDGNEQTMDHFFIHGLGHALGMDVHDVGDNGHVLKPGEVFTIEPGIYIESEALGVRIEDDYYVKPDGSLEKLSGSIPCEIDAIEKAIAAARAAEPKATP